MCDSVWEPVTTLSGCLSWRKSSTLFWDRLSLWRLQVMSNWQLKLTMTPMDDQTWQNSWKVLIYDQRSYFEQRLINTCELWICIPVCSQRSRESHYIEREVEWPPRDGSLGYELIIQTNGPGFELWGLHNKQIWWLYKNVGLVLIPRTHTSITRCRGMCLWS